MALLEKHVRLALIFAAALMTIAAFPPSAQAATRVYLLKGFANVFSTGLDTLAKELVVRGCKVTVDSHMNAEELGLEAAKHQKSGKDTIIIIGHSLGADAAVTMAKTMKRDGAKVLLLVTFGPDYQQAVPLNVEHVVNFYQGDDALTKGKGFKGTLRNVNLDKRAGINHFNVEKIGRLHAEVISEIEALTAKPRGTEAQASADKVAPRSAATRSR